LTAAVDPTAPLTWDVARDLRQLFAFPFMVNALQAGTIIAVAAASIGWFMVLRRQSFAGHTLALVGFPGAAGATWLGVSAMWGFLTFCTVAGLVIAAIPPGDGHLHTEEAAGIGVVQSFALACGFLFVSLYSGNLTGINGLLFGSFLGVTGRQVLGLRAISVVALVVLAVVGRPLMFASVDADVAAASGVPVRAMSVVFLLLLGLTAAAVSQITGSLFVFALLVMPPATAQLLTARPAVSLALAISIALGVTWTGLAAAYYWPYPIGFFVTTFAFAGYVAARAGAAARDRRRSAPMAR
jgi:zinc/manganese transport system permease protein